MPSLPWDRKQYDSGARNRGDDDLGTFEERAWYKRFSLWYAFGALVTVIGLMAIVIATSKKSSGSGSKSGSGFVGGPYNSGGSGDDEIYADPYEGIEFTNFGPIQPEPEIPTQLAGSNKNELKTMIETDYYDANGWEWPAVSEEAVAQNKALDWLSGTAAYADLNEERRVQRYALAVFYYSTYMQSHEMLTSPAADWVEANLWLSDEHECLWLGVACDTNYRVTGLKLVANGLSGSIPLDLALLTSLTTLNLAQNFIFMKGDLLDVFRYMQQLEELVLDDNFISVSFAGIPPQLGFLSNLRKLQMSYNLLQGQLTGALFANLAALTHLELESNYLTGTIPPQLGQIPNLIYAYLRRNSLEVNLDDLLEPEGAYPSIFSLWLDSNIISGTLPTKLGQLYELASFSITNTSLSGTIPTELGSLTNLQRVWLYQNSLTGPIPETFSSLKKIEVFEVYGNDISGTVPGSICSSVEQSEYEYKTISADCQEVTCTCCYACY